MQVQNLVEEQIEARILYENCPFIVNPKILVNQ